MYFCKCVYANNNSYTGVTCGSEDRIMVGDSPRNITSPGYPMRYPNEAYCSWDLSAPDGYRVKLEFLFIHIEVCDGVQCNCDVLVVCLLISWNSLFCKIYAMNNIKTGMIYFKRTDICGISEST